MVPSHHPALKLITGTSPHPRRSSDRAVVLGRTALISRSRGEIDQVRKPAYLRIVCRTGKAMTTCLGLSHCADHEGETDVMPRDMRQGTAEA